ncbi:hypothetical protein Curi_c14620 [Gottschalkia acidurici 9a]|uniref:Uncharacterized protein n=1 Tax=Gottschalkia acidurici (strain ATCC 7906 / DSM 604 / BCRC 14475 / CIP 104303 / KCTC 5404 / NCIMB 10678 / 9a) TaxID=1128398 RepID=K0B0A1_GOTA9|nr:hypothetical protein [Gottschalkia acidurici]AFS78472.1 hypothetical protein Curi_c14620 [Gottschalkia acidurici 9a]
MNYPLEIKAIKEVDKGTDLITTIPNKCLKYDMERYKQVKKTYADIRLNDERKITIE